MSIVSSEARQLDCDELINEISSEKAQKVPLQKYLVVVGFFAADKQGRGQISVIKLGPEYPWHGTEYKKIKWVFKQAMLVVKVQNYTNYSELTCIIFTAGERDPYHTLPTYRIL